MALNTLLKPFRIVLKIRETILMERLISGVDTGDKLE
jgi:hypothetical protein